MRRIRSRYQRAHAEKDRVRTNYSAAFVQAQRSDITNIDMLIRNVASSMGLIAKIVSGAQTGADRAGLEWALENSILHGGWCPRGATRLCRSIPPSDANTFALTRRNKGAIVGATEAQESETLGYEKS